MAKNELPIRGNKRGGPGWWMDLDGQWRSPETWPEDTPPLEGWIRQSDGSWRAPDIVVVEDVPERPKIKAAQNATATIGNEATSKGATKDAPRLSRQAQADRKAIFTVVGILAGGLIVLAAALFLINSAGAEDIAVPEEPQSSVIFSAETEAVRLERQQAAALEAPANAVAQLADLGTTTDAPANFDLLDWTAERTDCLDIGEQVLVRRSTQPIVFADQLGCVPDSGRWTDRYLGTSITRTLDADVSLHVPAAIAFASGGHEWTPATRQAYLTDIAHPATFTITTAGSGHNPRGHGPAEWRPSVRSTWCAYAIDWVGVKARWELTVTDAEREALQAMLATCDDADSDGPRLASMVIDSLSEPTINRIDGLGE